jgi:iron complex outermembrane receptor protein
VRTDIEFEDTLRPSPQLRLVWGGGLRRDEVTSALAFGTPDTIAMDYLRLFSHAEWRLAPKWLVNLGGMYEHHDLTGHEFSPRLAINYRLRPNHSLRLAASRATRVPVAYEEMANLVFSVDTPSGPVTNQAYVSSGGLDAETINAVEIGYIGHYLDQRLDVDARLYHEQLSGLIARRLRPVTDYNGFLYDYVSADHARVTGAELQLDYRIAPRHFYRLAYGYTQVDSADNAQPLSASAPEHLLTLFGTRPLSHGLQGTAIYYYSSGHTYLTDFDGGLGGYPLDPIHRIDLRLSYPIRNATSSGRVSVVAQSVLGDYHDYDATYRFPRRIWLELALESP